MEISVSLLPEVESSNLCLLPQNIFESLELVEETLYKLHIGQNMQSCSFKSYVEPGVKAYFSRELINQLLLTEGMTINVWKKYGEIYLGPVVGIFINSDSLLKIQKNFQVIDRFKHIEASFKANCISYFFSVNSINWQEKKIYGYTFNFSENKWNAKWFPLPTVMYDRAEYYSAKEIPLANHLFYQLIYVLNIPFINTFNILPKWHTHVKLSKYREINAYLPETIRYRSFNDVVAMLDRFNFIFMKASVGCRGKEVLSIRKIDNKFKLNYYLEGLKEVLLDDLNALKSYINNFTRKRIVIVQQGVNLLKYQGHNMDLRIILVKDVIGNWQGTNVRSRIANGSQTITNHAAGGDIVNYEEIYEDLKSSYSGGNLPNKDDLIETAKNILSYIELEFGRLGEIGIDLAIDEDYKIWFIEGNPKLDKKPFEGLDDLTNIWPPALAIFEYAKFLADIK